jgi:N utilization substance protein B
VLRHRDELDRIIERSAPNWPIAQMSRVDKAILRLAIFEVLFHNRVPLKAAINEAVELGKRFGSDSSSRFINGVLGTIAQQAQQMITRAHEGKIEIERSNGVTGPELEPESDPQEAG